MKRRQVLRAVASMPVVLTSTNALSEDKWGKGRGYPVGLYGGLSGDSVYRVGNYSGGFEKLLPCRTIKADYQTTYPFHENPSSLKYRSGFFQSTPDDYLKKWPVMGLLVVRGDNILYERYQYERTASMRMTSWSMAKSVTSLLLGICLDRKLIDSYDDLAEKYLPSLKGTLHGSVSLRNLSNMSSGADVLHNRDNNSIYSYAFLSATANIAATVAEWNRKREEAGTLYNYNELCPLTLGMDKAHCSYKVFQLLPAL
jgi:hypothetical protein